LHRALFAVSNPALRATPCLDSLRHKPAGQNDDGRRSKMGFRPAPSRRGRVAPDRSSKRRRSSRRRLCRRAETVCSFRPEMSSSSCTVRRIDASNAWASVSPPRNSFAAIRRLLVAKRKLKRSSPAGSDESPARRPRPLWLPPQENSASKVAARPGQIERAADLAIGRGGVGCAALEEGAIERS
jgi:hypothetical protein